MTQVKGYFKQDGTYVKPHSDKRPFSTFLKKHVPGVARLFEEDAPGDTLTEHELPHGAQLHPRTNEDGEHVVIYEPTEPTPKSTWVDKHAIATWTPGGKVPKALNGVPFEPWEDHPSTQEEWDGVEGQDLFLDEPPFESLGKPAAGVVIEEPDGRVWVIHPTNKFGSYATTFPKGRLEEGINLQASAIKEAFEESGLKVEITGWLADVERSVTTCRYYSARRVGGTPQDAGWESQAVSLVPRSKLYEMLNSPNDHGLAEALGAGPRPVIPKPEWKKPLAPAGLFDSKPSDKKTNLPPPILQKKRA